jgi:hypothetical protein
LLEETLLRPFLQVGVSLTLQLQQRAVALAKTLQQQVGEQWEAVLDSPFRETYAGVCRHPPMFFRGLDTAGEIFLRRFQNLAEIERVETVLNHTPLWFAVLSRWQLLSSIKQRHRIPRHHLLPCGIPHLCAGNLGKGCSATAQAG